MTLYTLQGEGNFQFRILRSNVAVEDLGGNMNPIITAQMTEFAQSYDLAALSPSVLFEKYSIFSVLSRHLAPTEDSTTAHLDSDEFGIDGVAIIVQGKICANLDDLAEVSEGLDNPRIEFHFFQSKTSSSFDYGDISKFLDATEQFFDGGLSGESEQLDDLIEVKTRIYQNLVTWKNPSLNCHYITTGNYKSPARIENLVSRRMSDLKDLNIFHNEDLKVDFIGAEKLQKMFRSATRSVKAKIEFPKQVSLPKTPKVQEGYIGFIDARQVVSMVTSNEDDEEPSINRSVFYDNIREYNPDAALNEKISESVGQENDGFVYRNNGITVIAKKIQRTGDEFKIEDFQIVNGCQTTNILFENSDHIDGVFVPFRLIGSDDPDFISSIIIGTNSQNAIKPEQFFSLSPFFKSLEEHFRAVDEDVRLYLERRESQYKHEQVERARIISISALMKAVASGFIERPHSSARDYKKIIKEFEGYLFQDGQAEEMYYALAYINYRLDFLWRNQRVDSSLKIYRFFFIWAIIQFLHGKGDVLSSLSGKKAKNLAKSIVDFCADEEKVIPFMKVVMKVIKKVVKTQGWNTREKLRDGIRSESFYLLVRKDLESHLYE